MGTPEQPPQVEEFGLPGAPEAVVVLASGPAAGAVLARRVAQFARVLLIRSPGGELTGANLNPYLERLGVKRAHLVVLVDPASVASTDQVVAYLQQTVTID